MNIFSIFNKKSSRRKNRGQGEGFKGLIAASDLKSPATEAYRVLRTNIHYATSEDEQRTLLFTSAGPGEGKSATSANTAVVLAQGGKKVVVIDCDLRKPTQHVWFGVERKIGQSMMLLKKLKFLTYQSFRPDRYRLIRQNYLERRNLLKCWRV